MNRKLLQFLMIAAVLVGVCGLTREPAEAQILKVNSKYRIVTVDRPGQRIGVALPKADPRVRQSWVYIRPDTASSMQKHYGNGYYKNHQLSFNEIFSTAEQRVGQFMSVKGGRDFDGSINAKKVWF
ncbi:MAG: hypothetical protein WC314_03090 [Vulcanimicrobiota bacterium]